MSSRTATSLRSTSDRSAGQAVTQRLPPPRNDEGPHPRLLHQPLEVLLEGPLSGRLRTGLKEGEQVARDQQSPGTGKAEEIREERRVSVPVGVHEDDVVRIGKAGQDVASASSQDVDAVIEMTRAEGSFCQLRML